MASWEVTELLDVLPTECDWLYERARMNAGAEQCWVGGVGLLLQSSKALEPVKMFFMSVTEPTFWTRHSLRKLSVTLAGWLGWCGRVSGASGELVVWGV